LPACAEERDCARDQISARMCYQQLTKHSLGLLLV
jgi:hypothetical protein